MDLQVSVTNINNAFLRLESYMNGTISDYQYFGFNEAFSKLFIEALKPENFTYSNCKLIGEYWKLTDRIKVDYDKSNFENYKAYKNKSFCEDCEEIMYLNWERIEDFMAFSTPDEITESERKFSITNIINNPALIPQQITKEETRQPETDLQTKIKLHFDFLQKDCPRKHKQILKDDDFEKLINWTVLYFKNDFKVPNIDEPIKIIRTNKTFVQGAFKALFNELQPSNTYPNSLFDFYKNAFAPYSKDKKENFDKARINNEVKKLMNINY